MKTHVLHGDTMFVGPFESVEKLDGKYRAKIMVYRPTGIGSYEQDYMYVFSDEEPVEKDGKLYFDTDDPWLKTLGLNARIIPPRIRGNRVENTVPVKIIENRDGRQRFYGYYVVFENGVPIEVKGAGIYERIVPPELNGMEPAIPAILVKDITELSKKEYVELAKNTPPELLVLLHRQGRRDIVATNVAETLREDPLRLAKYPRQIVENYLVSEQDLIVKLALLENTPMMISVLIEELKSIGYDADKLTLLYTRYLEETQEDKQLSRKEQEPEQRAREYEEELRKEEKTLLREFGPLIRKVLGIAFPLRIETPVLAEEVKLVQKKTEHVKQEAYVTA